MALDTVVKRVNERAPTSHVGIRRDVVSTLASSRLLARAKRRPTLASRDPSFVDISQNCPLTSKIFMLRCGYVHPSHQDSRTVTRTRKLQMKTLG